MSSGIIVPSLNTTLTTKGDILIHNGTSSARFAVGTSGHALQSTTSGPIYIAWASATTKTSATHELIASSTITASATTVSFLNISNVYSQFTLIACARNTADGTTIYVSLNTTASTANADYYGYESGGSYLRAVDTRTGDAFSGYYGTNPSTSPTGSLGFFEMTINQTLDRDLMAVKYRGHILRQVSGSSPATYYLGVSEGFGVGSSVSVPVSNIRFYVGGGAFASGSTFAVYGLRR